MRLMDHIEAFCLASDCSKIILPSNRDHRSAHDFYATMGYGPDEK